jgi:DNA polymerase-1
MSYNYVALPGSFDGFQAIWHIDFEFRFDANHCPIPVSLFAQEHRTGEAMFLRRRELLARRRAPFNTGPDVLVTGYSLVAELSCFQALGWPAPRHGLCTYIEAAAAINGADIVGLTERRPKLLEAASLFNILHPEMSLERKDEIHAIILNQVNYSENDWRAIEDLNRVDVLINIPLLGTLAPIVDLPVALSRVRYSAAVAAMEARGLPVDAGYLDQVRACWPELRRHYIDRDDEFHLYDDNGSFRQDRFAALIGARNWIWPQTETGKPDLKSATLGKQCKKHPELKRLQRLRDCVAELRLGAFLNTVGADGASRCPIMPFWTRSGRNQPQGRDKAFLLSLPSWSHGFISPRRGWGVSCLDWSGQEIGLGAGLSGDPHMIEDFRSGDPHIRFAIRVGLAPAGASKDTHGPAREQVKPVVHGVAYGMSKHGAAATTGKSLLWAADALGAHRHAYPIFYQWQQDVMTQALFDQRIVSPFGWPMAVHAGTKRRTLLNYMQQSSGADCLRIAAIAAHEAGIHLLAPSHDSVWIAAPLDDLDDAVATTIRLMERAGEAVAGIRIPVGKPTIVRWPQRLGDVRKPDAKGQALWLEIEGLVTGGLREERRRA